MELLKVLSLVLLVCRTFARPDKETHNYDESQEDASYEFQYQVQYKPEELDFGHHESKSSDGKVEGYYYVLLPDYRTQKVTYYVDDHSGFVAQVTYLGEAKIDNDISDKGQTYNYNKKDE